MEFSPQVSRSVVTIAPYTTVWDTTTVANGTVALNAKATDVDGNVGIVAADVTVSNGAPAVTLSQIQAAVFTPICSLFAANRNEGAMRQLAARRTAQSRDPLKKI